MKKIICFVFIYYSLFTIHLFAQVPTTQGNWQSVNGIVSLNGFGAVITLMKTDNKGNVYVCGSTGNNPYIKKLGQQGNRTQIVDKFQNHTNGCGFVAKYNCNDELQWFKQIGDTLYDSGASDMAVDSIGNVYLFATCTPFTIPTYFDTVLITPYAGVGFQTGGVILKINTNGNLIWKWRAHDQWGGYNHFRIRAETAYPIFHSMMVLNKDTLSMIATIDTSGPGGLYLIDFNTNSGQIIQTTKIKYGTTFGDIYGLGIDGNGNFLIASNASGNSITVLDSTINLTVTVGQSFVFNFTRTHLIEYMTNADSAGILQADLSDAKHGFTLTMSSSPNKKIFGNFASHNKIIYNSPFAAGSTPGIPIFKFDKINHPLWMLDGDSSYQGGDFFTPFSNNAGRTFCSFNVTKTVYYKGHKYTSPSPYDTYLHMAILQPDSGNMIQFTPQVHTMLPNSNPNLIDYFSGGVANEKGEAVLFGAFIGNDIYAGHDTAFSFGGSGGYTIRYGFPCGNDSALIEPIATTNLVVNCSHNDSIKLTWGDNSSIEWGYHVYRAIGSRNGTYIPIDTTLPNVTAFTDKTIVANTNYWYKVAAFNNIGDGIVTNIDSSMSCKTVGIDEVSKYKNDLKVFPNPTTTSIYIKSLAGNLKTIEITDVVGKTMKFISNNNQNSLTTIQVADLSNGIYFIKAIDENRRVFNTKFIKE